MGKSLQASRIRSVGRTSHAPDPGSHISISTELGIDNAATLVGRGVDIKVTDSEALWMGRALIEYATIRRALGTHNRPDDTQRKVAADRIMSDAIDALLALGE